MSTASPLSAQISCSWSWKPADPATDDPYFQKFAAQGQNFFTASGDSGSYPNSGGFYYPAEDAYVTAVGGTDLQVTKAGGPWSSETAWRDSGGGISPDNIPIPAWQQLARRNQLAPTRARPRCVMFRTSPQKPILTFTFVTTKVAVLQALAGPVSLRRCGPALWLSSINKRLPTAIRPSAS